MKTITMNVESYEKQNGKYILTNTEEKEIEETIYKNILNSKGFFRNLGGVEREKKNYTSAGYVVTQLTSISPDKDMKTVRSFKFD